ncbi:MAG TPA: lipocalin family protein [Sorangium sp.]|nr:lipocalin family protein [Sorangium sp.]
MTWVEPLADGVDEIWASPTTGQKYPTRWRVTLPELRAKLTVRITGTPGQELARDGNGRMEAAADFTGTYEGDEVSGKNYVEMIGNWQD